jgi:hypothetical protein
MAPVETFVIRVWVASEPLPAAKSGLRGFITHVTSGSSAPFVGAEQLLAFLNREREGQGPDGRPVKDPGQPKRDL